jgi:acetolactate synthase-1/2/3 large subunit
MHSVNDRSHTHRASDEIADRLTAAGVSNVFRLPGGGAMHLNDAFGHHPGLTPICCHHEQACAIAAEGYARVTGRPALVNVTTGPGAINAMNGVFGAWTDSIPMIVVSGQVKRETMMTSYSVPGLRQLGDQEADVLPMVRGITKYAAVVTEPESVRYHTEQAFHLATSGRPGPCWLDVPIDVQSAIVDPASLRGYDPPSPDGEQSARLEGLCREVVDRLSRAERPVIMVGTGVRLANAGAIFDRVIRRLGVPVTTAWTAIDQLDSDHPLHCGRPGSVGDRPGNFTVQNADLLLVLGSRLNIRQVSYNWKAFARHAFIVQVDVDPAELTKPTVVPDLPVVADLSAFLEELGRQLEETRFDSRQHGEWLAWCRARVKRYPVLQPRHREITNGRINPYGFVASLFDRLADDDVVACGDGSACVIPFQVGRIKRGQRVFCNSGCASMGYDLPAAIGAATARPGKRTICIAGDGSLQLNIQELATVAHHRWPLKIFVLNNNGYLSMRMTQGRFFGRLIGEGPASGVSLPDFVNVARAYGLPASRIAGGGYEREIERVLESQGPEVCEVMLAPAQEFEPKLSSRVLPDGRMVSAPLEDMAPFLDRDELRENLFIPAQEQ